MRVSFLPDASNRHSSTPSEVSENSEKLTPRPSQVAPLGKGDPADCCDLLEDNGAGEPAQPGQLQLRISGMSWP